ncbi:hypothetical protein FRB94_008042 [Tulasnella sp. JGI-2019a]|nr:hypothetical protein FRB93_003693 [Tulasnella sp. JGI-2019a]KAG8996747.1 hypothetical protein FRB94_008042 [Tulasnella sp. JGI-2019a]KAG9030594.1 hypothetical protein FRB95_003793 [Tulasnella sp. JGI-2019a]
MLTAIYRSLGLALAISSLPSVSAVFAAKRGLAWPSDNTFDPKVFATAGGGSVDYIYNWGTSPGTDFSSIPSYYVMQWNGANIANLAAEVKAAGSNVVMGFNEPDNSGQANMTPAAAAALWIQYIQPLRTSIPGIKLISPAVTNAGAPGGIAWMDSFIAACTGCTFDGIAIHWYGGWTGDFVSFVESAFKYNTPLYLTEFGFSWDADATVDSFTQFLPLAMCYLDNTPQVAQYAFFGAFYSGTAKDMLTSTGALTTVGNLYATYNAQGCNVTATTGGTTTSIASSSATSTTTSTAAGSTSTAGATYVGCYTDSGSPRTLSSYSTTSASMTNALCESTCFGMGYTYAGTEYSDECYCGNSLASGTLDATDSDCNGPCAGDSTTKCGGSYRLSVYKSGGTTTTSKSTTSTTTTKATTSTSTKATSTTTATGSAGTAYVGCYTDSGTTRTLNGTYTTSSAMTNPLCESTCYAAGYTYAGTEYSDECYCGNGLTAGTLDAVDSDCNGPCAGDSTTKCGGTYRLSVYKVK